MRGYEATQKSEQGTFSMKKSTADQRISQLSLDILPEKEVTLAFDGEDVSGNAGLLLVAQAEKLTKLLRGAAERLDDHRTQSLIKHNMFEQIAQRVFQIIAGCSATADSDSLRGDPALKAAVGRNPLSGEDLAGHSTQQRLETERQYKELYKLSQWLVEYYIECHRKPPKRLVLDFDGSAIETYGVQLNAFYRGGPYGKFMYFPLFVFDENGWLLVAALRPGDHGEVKWSLPILKRLVRRLRQAWPRVEIVVRADGAFTDNELYKWMDENRVRYVLGMKDNHSLFVKTKQFRAKAQSKFKRKYEEPRYLGKSGKKAKNKRLKEISSTYDKDKRQQARQEFEHRRARVYGETSYAARSWDRERRVIARCDYTDSGLEVRYVVTNLTGYQARQVYEDVYCRRARCEMWIKSIKETRCDRLSCSQFKSNMFRLLMHALAYILIHQVQIRLEQNGSVTQFQRTFIHVAVRVRETRKGVEFQIA